MFVIEACSFNMLEIDNSSTLFGQGFHQLLNPHRRNELSASQRLVLAAFGA